MNEIGIRGLKNLDLAFILSTWLESYRKSPFAHRIKNSVFFPHHRKIAEHLLAKCITRVAHLPDEEDVILGYICAEPPKTVHYIFVKDPWRNMHIAKRLLEDMGFNKSQGFQFTHWTKPFDETFEIDQVKLVYNPYAL